MHSQHEQSFHIRRFLTTPGVGRTVLERQRNQIVYSQGDPADAIFYVQNGNIKLTVLSPEGKEAVVAISGAETLFGESCLGGEPVRHATATAVTDCLLTRIGKNQMLDTLREQPAFSEFFLSYVLSRNIHLEADLVDQLCNSCEKRLARVLLLLANFEQDSKSTSLALPRVNQDTLAAMVGTTRPRISFFLNKFKRQGFIELRGGLQINSSLVNAVLRDGNSCKEFGDQNKSLRIP